MGYSEHTQRPQAPQKALGRLWGCTHSHMKGDVGKTKCHLSTTAERAPRGLCWEDLGLRDSAQGRQRLLGHSHSHFHAWGIPGNTRSGAVATGLWLSQAEKSGCVPGDEQQPLSHSGHPTLWKHFPRCQRAELQAQLGEITAAPSFQGLFSCPACGSSAPVLVGNPSECLVFPACSSQSSVCSVPAAILWCYQ